MLLKFEEISHDESVQIVRAPVLNPETLLRILVNNFLAVQNLKMALKKANISQHTTTIYYISQHTKDFSSDTPQSNKRQNKGPKEHDGKYTPCC